MTTEELQETKKRPLVLFSGGLDSTYLLWCWLKDGADIDILTVIGGKSALKDEAETIARDKILKAFDTDEALKGKIRNHYTFNIDTTIPAKQSMFAMGFRQPILWLYGALESVDPRIHSSVNICYVGGDAINPLLATLRSVWNGLYRIHCSPCDNEPTVELGFPTCFNTKQDILNTLPEHYQELTWVCELPIKTKDDIIVPCEDCGACRRSKTEKIMFDLSRGVQNEKV